MSVGREADDIVGDLGEGAAGVGTAARRQRLEEESKGIMMRVSGPSGLWLHLAEEWAASAASR